MTRINLALIGPPAAVNNAFASVVTAITGSGVGLTDDVRGNADIAFSDPTTLTGLTITGVTARVIFPLSGTRVQFDSLKTSLATVKASSPNVHFVADYVETANV